MSTKKNLTNFLIFVLLVFLACLFLAPILVILINSVKGQFDISTTPFALPTDKTFVGLENYFRGIEKIDFFKAFGYTLFITVFSVLAIVLFTAMTAWIMLRVKSKLTRVLYYMFVFSMIVPFPMVMFPMSKMANMLHLDNPIGLILIYVGFGSGMSIFMFTGFMKSIPVEIEEAAIIDGCNPFQLFFYIVFPILRPTAITIAILNAMWIWNDYLLPYLVLPSEYRTLPVAIQYLQGGFGSVDMGAMMAMLVLSIIPIIVFYLACQKHIIKGVTAGAVKG